MIPRLCLPILPTLALLTLAVPAWSQPAVPAAPPEAPSVRAERLEREALRAQLAAEMAPTPDVNRSTQAFQVTLLLATTGNASQDLPKAAREAVDGLKDFLPYKGYSVLDFAWVRSAGSSQTQIKGPDDRTFRVVLRYDDPEENEGRVFIRDFRLEEDSSDDPRHAPGGREMLLRPGGRALISTSFGMEIGETVVVGTSRLNGDGKALVVLLTAIPASVAGR